jgi:Xaa-Pro dipeptidase
MHAIHREKIIQRMTKRLNSTSLSNKAILLHGGSEMNRYDTDTTHAFRQESFFQYLFGVKEPDCAGLIDMHTKKSILFIPRLNEEWELWCGERKSLHFFKSHYQVDAVYYMDEILNILQDQLHIKKLFLLRGKNTDSGLETSTTSTFEGIGNFDLDYTILYQELVECRVIKSEKELELLRFINTLSSQAHMQVMHKIQPGQMEFHAESEFLYFCYSQGGARLHAYTCICGSGNNAATLHYGHAGAPNDKKLSDKDLLLNDMGAELHGYASDITCTFPINGKFTKDQKMIYEGVLKAHNAVLQAIQPGVSYIDMHLLSHRVLTQHLLENGLFQNGTVDELMDHEISAFFYPHGLGHFMGLDVHDVGGYPMDGPKRSEKKILQKLRLVRILEPGMVLTVEPGCYFIEAQIQKVLANPQTCQFLNQEMLARFRGTGGVRIESNVIVTKNGAENITQVPRTVEEIEKWMMNRKN